MTHSSEISPPPFMVGAAEVEVDLETGEAQVIRYEAAVDCGTPVNPNLARVQAEGGILQGIGMALTENVTYDDRGMPQENSLMQYKIPARNDIGHIHVVFESSYEAPALRCQEHRRGGHQYPAARRGRCDLPRHPQAVL